MSGDPEIRSARPEEAEALSHLAMRSKAMHGYSQAFLEACRKELTWTEADIRNPLFRFAVLESAGVVVGFAALLMHEDGQAELEALFIDPGHTGRGFGGGLLRHVSKEARDYGIKSVRIQSDPDAVSFYLRYGVAIVGESPSGSIPGRMLPELLMDPGHPLLVSPA